MAQPVEVSSLKRQDQFSSSSDSDNVSDVSSKQYVTSTVFASGVSADFYEPIPEYEGRHRYDPSAEWTDKEEKRLVRKVCDIVGIEDLTTANKRWFFFF
jgi:hypothetical protein